MAKKVVVNISTEHSVTVTNVIRSTLANGVLHVRAEDGETAVFAAGCWLWYAEVESAAPADEDDGA